MYENREINEFDTIRESPMPELDFVEEVLQEGFADLDVSTCSYKQHCVGEEEGPRYLRIRGHEKKKEMEMPKTPEEAKKRVSQLKNRLAKNVVKKIIGYDERFKKNKRSNYYQQASYKPERSDLTSKMKWRFSEKSVMVKMVYPF